MITWKEMQKEDGKEARYWLAYGNRRLAFQAHVDFFELLYQMNCKFLHNKTFNKALEIGTGASGGFLGVIRHINKRYAVDSKVDFLREHNLLPLTSKIKYLNGYGETLPYDNGSFDLVIISNALDHCKDMKKVVEEMKRVLKDKKYLLFMTYLKVKNPHPWTFETIEEAKEMFKGMEVMEEHFVNENTPYRRRNDYYVAIFQK